MTPSELLRQLRTPSAAKLRYSLKTALAAIITFLVYHALDLPQGYWAVISAIIIMQSSLGGSLQAGWYRLFGTAIGAGLAVAAISLFPPEAAWGVAAALFITTALSAYLNYTHESFKMAGITAVIIILMGESGLSPLEAGMHRFLEISLGIGVALLVSFVLFPSKAAIFLRHSLGRTFEVCADFQATAFACLASGECRPQDVLNRKESLLKLILTDRRLLEQARREPGCGKILAEGGRSIELAANLSVHLRAMSNAAQESQASGFHMHLDAELAELSRATQAGLRCLAVRMESGGPCADSEGLQASALELGRAVRGVEDRLLELRGSRASWDYDFDDVIGFFSFWQAMRASSKEVLAHLESLAGEGRKPD